MKKMKIEVPELEKLLPYIFTMRRACEKGLMVVRAGRKKNKLKNY
jgi:hypothetical protein